MRTIEDVLRMNGKTPCSVNPETSVYTALKLMAAEQIGALPVIEAGELVGVIYEKDCITEVMLNGGSIEATRVMEIMDPDIINISPGQTVEECLEVLTNKNIQYLPVMAGISLVGFVSLSDLFRKIINDQMNYIYWMDDYVWGLVSENKQLPP